MDFATVIATLPWAIGVNAIVAWLGYRARTVSLSGMLGGAAVGVVIFAAGGAHAWALLFLAFLTATLTSRLGLRRKTRLGIAEARGGRAQVLGELLRAPDDRRDARDEQQYPDDPQG